MARQATGESTPLLDVLPHPAEDLSADDDLLSWVLVDQLGCMPNTKLGVHPQQVKFVGPSFKTEDVLNVVRETITKGNLQGAMQKLQEFGLFQQHIQDKMTVNQKERFVQHLRRYLLPLLPTSRLEIYLTNRYTFVTGHAELAVFATRPLAPGLVMHELQGSVVPLPQEWKEEMDIGDDLAVEAAGEENEEEDDGGSMGLTPVARDRKSVIEEKKQGQRRSDRTKRRDFSIVWSGLKQCYQLFLGPARFINHDCDPNVELLRQGKYVTFRVTRPIKIGEELTTFYGENYFGKGNIECLCLTCEQKGNGGFTTNPKQSSCQGQDRGSRSTSVEPSLSRHGSSFTVDYRTQSRDPSSLRNESQIKSEICFDGDRKGNSVELSTMSLTINEATEGLCGTTPEDTESLAANVSRLVTPTPTDFESTPVDDNSMYEETESTVSMPRRERYVRKAAQNPKPWSRWKRGRKGKEVVEYDEPVELDQEFPPDFPRCATCAKPLTEQIWYCGRYFDHCQRCVRHALVFELPWPARRPQDVQEYPPAHLVPSGFIPRKILTVPLPSLSKTPRIKTPAVQQSSVAESHHEKRARRLREEIEAETFFIESLREAAWSVQESREAAREAKEEERKRRREEKMRLDATRIKGQGIWSRYEYITEEEFRKKQEEIWIVEPGSSRRCASKRDTEEEIERRKRVKEMLEQRKKNREAKKKDKEQRREWLGLAGKGSGPMTLMELGETERTSLRESVVSLQEVQPIKKRGKRRRPTKTKEHENTEVVNPATTQLRGLEKFHKSPSFRLPKSPGLVHTQEKTDDDDDIEDEILVAIAPELSPIYPLTSPNMSMLPTTATMPARRPFARRPLCNMSSQPMSRSTCNPKITPTSAKTGKPCKHPKSTATILAPLPTRQPIMLHIPARRPTVTNKEAVPVTQKSGRPPGSSKIRKALFMSHGFAVTIDEHKDKHAINLKDHNGIVEDYRINLVTPPTTATPVESYITADDSEPRQSTCQSSASDASLDARLSSPVEEPYWPAKAEEAILQIPSSFPHDENKLKIEYESKSIEKDRVKKRRRSDEADVRFTSVLDDTFVLIN
nr:hypothetical protein L204_02652 [Cryptococcus depauperatus CBS 7855]